MKISFCRGDQITLFFACHESPYAVVSRAKIRREAIGWLEFEWKQNGMFKEIKFGENIGREMCFGFLISQQSVHVSLLWSHVQHFSKN